MKSLFKALKRSAQMSALAGALWAASLHAQSHTNPRHCSRLLESSDAPITADHLMQQLIEVEVGIQNNAAYTLLPDLDALTDEILDIKPGAEARLASDVARLQAQLDQFVSSVRKSRVNTVSAQTQPERVVFSRQARRSANEIPSYLREKLNEFINEMNNPNPVVVSLNIFVANGRWQLEKLSDRHGEYTVRLNKGYRVNFIIPDPDHIEIIAVDKTCTHR